MEYGEVLIACLSKKPRITHRGERTSSLELMKTKQKTVINVPSHGPKI